jgi:hypothetical protein
MAISSSLLLAFLLVSLSLCTDCYQGEYLDSTGQCQQCDISCATCKSSQSCSSCYSQMFIVAQGTQLLCDLCYNVLPLCESCISAQKCQTCSTGYYPDSEHVCQNCSNFEPYCTLCRESNGGFMCVQCQNTHQIVNNRCTPIDPNFVGNATGSNSTGVSNNQNAQTNNANTNQTAGTNASNSSQAAPTTAQKPNGTTSAPSSGSSAGIVKISPCQSH